MKRARRCSVSWARRARTLRFSSRVTLVSHRGGRSCGFPMLKGAFVTSFSRPARSCARVAHSEKVIAMPPSSTRPTYFRCRSRDHATAAYCTLRTSSRYSRRRSTITLSNSLLRTSWLISPTAALRYRNHYCIYSSTHKTLSSCHKSQVTHVRPQCKHANIC